MVSRFLFLIEKSHFVPLQIPSGGRLGAGAVKYLMGVVSSRRDECLRILVDDQGFASDFSPAKFPGLERANDLLPRASGELRDLRRGQLFPLDSHLCSPGEAPTKSPCQSWHRNNYPSALGTLFWPGPSWNLNPRREKFNRRTRQLQGRDVYCFAGASSPYQ